MDLHFRNKYNNGSPAPFICVNLLATLKSATGFRGKERRVNDRTVILVNALYKATFSLKCVTNVRKSLALKSCQLRWLELLFHHSLPLT